VKFLRKILERQHKRWENSRLLKPWLPLLEAMDAFLFRRAENARVAPFFRDRIEIKRYMMIVVIGLAPATVAAVYFWGWHCVLLIAVSYLFGGAAEVIFSVVRKEEVNEGFLVTGILFPLILPAATPWWVVALGVVFGVVIGKEIFGGTGKNFFNPAIVARVFVFICFPVQTAGAAIWDANAAREGWPGGFARWSSAAVDVDAVSSPTPLAARKQWAKAEAGPGRAKLKEAIPDLKPMFLGDVRGSMGETSAVLLILGGVFLVVCRIASWRIILATLVSGAAFSGAMHLAGLRLFAPPLYTLLAGGYMLGAFFMATDPVSAPGTKQAQWFYGVIIGVATVTIRSISGYAGGMMFAILLANVFSPLMDYMVMRKRYRRRKALA
jgi:Na(+)-translocating NADH:ubiquinone oxidoreductase B subunit